MMLRIHFIHETKGLLLKANLCSAPRAGDEVRLAGDKYFKVTRVIWPLDEPSAEFQRVNVGLTDVL